ncbi:hypothetical protein [Shewanella sp. UCD-KL12]|uniref:hypothetical protein n=1 Tax=Shewanella sp. UCD-KL12 TaxID=1917163 RepID=UPI0009710B49|nr:hypothetical protein [Shewanella sp. UCD-KL12]
MKSREIVNYLKVVVAVSVVSLTGCAELNNFPMGESYHQVKQLQILDMNAPERNEGIVLTLEGNYGEKVMKSYRDSNYLPRNAREKITIKVNK